jgi:two-component system, sensor histidine kinase and response regulator
MEERTTQPTILVVEDDPSMLEIISFLLEDEGYSVVQAHNGQGGLATLEDTRPNLIISDVMMPGMDGFDFYERVRARGDWAQIPFVFLTAKGQRTDVRRGMGLGADDYLTKPFEPEELLSAVKVRLARAADAQAAISKAGSDLSERIIQTLTHEFRTPLALVVGYTDLLEASGEEMVEEERQLILQGLQSGAQRLTGLVEDFLLLNRLESGGLTLEVSKERRATTEPDWGVELVVDQFKERAAQQNVELIVRLDAAGVTVAASHRHITEIIRKLIDNAVKFSKREGGQVVVSTHVEKKVWVLQVADNGIGIRQEALSWIFDAFRQVDRDRMEQQGSGIGLAIVRGLVEAYGGYLEVKSVLDQGSVFTVRLPLILPRIPSGPDSGLAVRG